MFYPVLSYGEFWMLEITFIVIFTSLILKIQIGIHKKITVFIVAGVLFFFRIINCLLPLTHHKECGNKDCKDIFLTDNNLFDIIKILFGSYYYIPLIFFTYTTIAIMRDYSWVKTKYLIDIKSVPLYKIFIFYGVVGSLIFIAGGFMLSYIPCETLSNVEKVYNDKKNMYEYYFIKDNKRTKRVNLSRYKCIIKDYVENKNELKIYYDNIFQFFDFFKEFNKNNKIEIFALIPLFLFFNGIINFSEIIMIKHFDPNIILISHNLYYFIQKIIQFWVNKGDEQYLIHIQFVIYELEEIISLIANMIYLEIIELRFCNLNYDTKTCIQQRSDLDYNIMDDFNNNSQSSINISFAEK